MGEEYTFHYNALNHLSRAEISTPQRSSTVDYLYDSDGIRTRKTVNGADVTTYLVDINRPYAQVLEERRMQGIVDEVAHYVYAGELLARTQDDVTRYYHTDSLGNVRALSDDAANVTDTYQYDAYGRLLEQTGSTDNPYRYRGEQYDADLESYYLRARYYHQDVGRFSAMDPVEGTIGDPYSAHRYLYGYADPVNNLDPSGQMNFTEIQTTAKIVGTLSAFASGSVALLSADEKTGAQIAELFPDAGIVGVSAGLQFKLFQRLLDRQKVQFPALGGGSSTGFYQYGPTQPILNWMPPSNAGAEILFSLSSAQIGIYQIWIPFQFELGQGKFNTSSPTGGDFIDIPITYYHGLVWNLWNTDDYKGAFVTANIGIRKFGMTLFQAPGMLYQKPFGVSFPFASISAGKTTFQPQATTGGSFAWYSRNLVYEKNCSSMYEVALWWTAAEVAALAISSNSSIQDPTGLISSAIMVSWPFTIARLKDVWNRYQHDHLGKDYTIKDRQELHIRRPDKFNSTGIKGPLFWGL